MKSIHKLIAVIVIAFTIMIGILAWSESQKKQKIPFCANGLTYILNGIIIEPLLNHKGNHIICEEKP